MTLVFSLIFNFLPLIAVFVCFCLLIKDFKFLTALFACLLGILAIIPISAVQFLLDKTQIFKNNSLLSILINDLILNGLIEESFKMLLLFLIPSKNTKLYNFFAYSIICGLTFACFENLIYFIVMGGTQQIELRIFTSMLIHLTCTALSGIFVYSVKNHKKIFSPYIWAICLHGIYNYFAGFKMNTPFFYFSFVVILTAFVECRLFYKKLNSKLGSADVKAKNSDTSL